MLSIYFSHIQNVKNVRGVADYKYIVMSDAEKIAEGKIIGHKLKDGWRKLLGKIVERGEE